MNDIIDKTTFEYIMGEWYTNMVANTKIEVAEWMKNFENKNTILFDEKIKKQETHIKHLKSVRQSIYKFYLGDLM